MTALFKQVTLLLLTGILSLLAGVSCLFAQSSGTVGLQSDVLTGAALPLTGNCSANLPASPTYNLKYITNTPPLVLNKVCPLVGSDKKVHVGLNASDGASQLGASCFGKIAKSRHYVEFLWSETKIEEWPAGFVWDECRIDLRLYVAYQTKSDLSYNPNNANSLIIPAPQTNYLQMGHDVILTVNRSNKSFGGVDKPSARFNFNDNDFVLEAAAFVNSLTFFRNGVAVNNNTLPANSELQKFFELSIASNYETHKVLDQSDLLFQSSLSLTAETNELNVCWASNYCAADEYDLEWTWVDAKQVDLAGNEISNSDQLTGTFYHNATRVTTKQSFYPVPLIYEDGFLVFRIRPVVYVGANFDIRREGRWSFGSGATTFTIEQAEDAQNDDAYCVVYQINGGHHAELNWAHSITFAEEGKRKQVVSYFDGTLRNRQTVTRVTSDQNVLVAETYYDLEGRAAVTALPAPAINGTTYSNLIDFYPKFNQNYNGQAYDLAMFNPLTANNDCQFITQGFNNLAGAGRYYSPNSIISGTAIHQNYVPDATRQTGGVGQGQVFPFVQTAFTRDNTGRVSSQGGVGPDHQLKTGHETKTYYTTPVQEELDRLFGSFVGEARFYKKQILIDPNGQVQITYLDPTGQAIATALAGNAPLNNDAPTSAGSGEPIPQFRLDPLEIKLYEQYSAAPFDVDLLKFDRKPFESTLATENVESYSELSHTYSTELFFSVPTNLDYEYSINQQNLEISEDLCNLCAECVYDVRLMISEKECGAIVYQENFTVGEPSQKVNDVLVCNQPDNTPVPPKIYPGSVIQMQPGAYVFTRVITVNEEQMEKYADDYLDNSACSTQLTFPPTDCSGCGLECEGCQIASFCENTRKAMLADVSPGGQYGFIDNYFSPENVIAVSGGSNTSAVLSVYTTVTNDPLTISVYGVLSCGSILPIAQGQAPWQHPVGHYQNEQGQQAQIFYQGEFQNPEDVPLDIFIQNWQPSWAESLLPYHPEFPMLAMCDKIEQEPQGNPNCTLPQGWSLASANQLFAEELIRFTSFNEQSNPPNLSTDVIAKFGFINSNSSEPKLWAYDPLVVLSTCYSNLNGVLIDGQIVGQQLLNGLAVFNTFQGIPNGNNQQINVSYSAWEMAILSVVCDASANNNFIAALNNTNTGITLVSATGGDGVADFLNCNSAVEFLNANQNNFNALPPATQLAIWQKYLGFYMQVRQMVFYQAQLALAPAGYTNDCINQTDFVGSGANTPTCIACSTSFANNYSLSRVRFPNPTGDGFADALETIDFADFSTPGAAQDAANVETAAKINEHCDKICNANRQIWANRIKGCTTDQALIDKILDGFVAVCEGGCDVNNPFGASSGLNSTVLVEGQPVSSFNEVLVKYLGANYPCPNCDINLIDFPLAYGQNYFPNQAPLPTGGLNQAPVGGSNALDQCACDSLKQAYCDFPNYFPTGYTRIRFELPNFQNTPFRQFLGIETPFGNFYAPTSLFASVNPNVYRTPLQVAELFAASVNSLLGAQNMAAASLDNVVYLYFLSSAYASACTTAINTIHLKWSTSAAVFPGPGVDNIDWTNAAFNLAIACPAVTNHPVFTTFPAYLNFHSNYAYNIPAFSNTQLQTYICRCNNSAQAPLPDATITVDPQLTCPSVPTCLGCEMMATAFQVFSNTLPYSSLLPCDPTANVGCNGQDDQNFDAYSQYTTLLTNFLNRRFQFTLQWEQHYLPFFKQCALVPIKDRTSPSDWSNLLPDQKSICNARFHIQEFAATPTPGAQLCNGDFMPKVNVLTNNCCLKKAQLDSANAWSVFIQARRREREDFKAKYRKKCLQALATEKWKAKYQLKEYHYTLYYYDRAAELVRTVPPNAVRPLSMAGVDSVKQHRDDDANPVWYPIHGRTQTLATQITNYEYLATDYVYYSFKQPIATTSPDGGRVKFYYDLLNKLVVMRHEKHDAKPNSPANSGDEYYTCNYYDNLDRLVFSGDVRFIGATNAGPLTVIPVNEPFDFNNNFLRKPTFVINANGEQVENPEFDYYDWLFTRNDENGDPTRQTYFYDYVRTYYDDYDIAQAAGVTNVANVVENHSSLRPRYLRNRIAVVTYKNGFSIGLSGVGGLPIPFDIASIYDYDVHGNVANVLEYRPDLVKYEVAGQTNQWFHALKRMDYEYDLIAGKVNQLTYQAGRVDQYIHRFDYDADNRLRTAKSGHDPLFLDNDAAYNYYRHGVLARAAIGHLGVQGLDYAYTIHGWIKAVNGGVRSANRPDIGRDGQAGSLNARYAVDAMGYALSYYNAGAAVDYRSVGAAAQPVEMAYNAGLTPSAIHKSAPSLWNGNIRAMSTVVRGLTNGYEWDQFGRAETQTPHGFAYRYDQLNRLVCAKAFDNADYPAANADNWAAGMPTGYTAGVESARDRYLQIYAYDPNGNIQTQRRNGVKINNKYELERTKYYYDPQTNRLNHLVDSAGKVMSDDLSTQAANNYQYDALGNIVRNTAEGDNNIVWNAQQKVIRVEKTNGAQLLFTYNGMGQRATKSNVTATNTAVITWTKDKITYTQTRRDTTTTHYVRNPQGEVMAIYESRIRWTKTGNRELTRIDSLYWKETHIYGSARLGIFAPDSLWTIINWKYSYNQQGDLTVTKNAQVNKNYPQGTSMAHYSYSLRGKKRYELSNHLGNVLSVVSDRKIAKYNNATVDYYVPDVLSAQDYYAFGATLPNRRAALSNKLIIKFTLVDGNNNGNKRTFSLNVNWKNGNGIQNKDYSYKPSGGASSQCGSGNQNTTMLQALNDFVSCYSIYSGILVKLSGGNTIEMIIDPSLLQNMNLPPNQIVNGLGSGNLSGSTQSYGFDNRLMVEAVSKYRYGFNGMESEDSDIEGVYSTEFRFYDSRVGRWSSVDALSTKYPNMSPYNFAINSPLIFVDTDGLDIKPKITEAHNGARTPATIRELGFTQLTSFRPVYNQATKSYDIELNISITYAQHLKTAVAPYRQSIEQENPGLFVEVQAHEKGHAEQILEAARSAVLNVTLNGKKYSGRADKILTDLNNDLINSTKASLQKKIDSGEYTSQDQVNAAYKVLMDANNKNFSTNSQIVIDALQVEINKKMPQGQDLENDANERGARLLGKGTTSNLKYNSGKTPVLLNGKPIPTGTGH